MIVEQLTSPTKILKIPFLLSAMYVTIRSLKTWNIARLSDRNKTHSVGL